MTDDTNLQEEEASRLRYLNVPQLRRYESVRLAIDAGHTSDVVKLLATATQIEAFISGEKP